ncbi:MAG: hypothetical protein DMF69_22125, partial [Acidobacteria bacterium]
ELVQTELVQTESVQIALVQNGAIRSVMADCHRRDATVVMVAHSVAAVPHCVAMEVRCAVGPRRGKALHFVAAVVDR